MYCTILKDSEEQQATSTRVQHKVNITPFDTTDLETITYHPKSSCQNMEKVNRKMKDKSVSNSQITRILMTKINNIPTSVAKVVKDIVKGDEENNVQIDNNIIKDSIPNASDYNYYQDVNMGIYVSRDDYEVLSGENTVNTEGSKQSGDLSEEEERGLKLLDSFTDGTTSDSDTDRSRSNAFENKEIEESCAVGELSEKSEEVISKGEEPETEVQAFEPSKEKLRLTMRVNESTDLKREADKASDKPGKAGELSHIGEQKSLWEELLGMRHFRISPPFIEVFMLSAPRQQSRPHPKAIGDIPWTWLREEKWRLHTFATYPHNTAKSAILLASQGFAYMGSGKDRDDNVICFFCRGTKKEWLPSDNIQDVHKAISPNCPMVTGVNCNNISMSAPKNGPGLFSSLLEQKPRNGGHGRGGNEIESDSVPVAGQESQARPTREGVPSNTHKPVQMAESSIGQPSLPRAASRPNTSSNSSTVTTQQATNSNAPSSTVVSGHSVARQPTQPQQARPSNNLSHDAVTTVSQPSPTQDSTSTRASTAPSSASQAQSNTQGSSRPAAPSTASSPNASTTSNTSNTNQTSNTQAQQGSNSDNSSQSSTRPAPGRGPTYGDLGIITERPKRYEYAVRARRLETFEHWPRDHHLKKEDLSSAGFYYAGYGDCARCFYCGGGLRNWEDDDNVWVEHARWFPKCAFIRQQMGQAFVDTVQDLNKDHDQISFKMVTDKMGSNAVSFQLDSSNVPLKRDPAVRTVIDMGYQEKDVLAAAAFVKENNTILSADKLFEKLEADGKARVRRDEVADSQAVGGTPDPSKDKETMDTLKDQNNQLRQQTVCKICMDKEVAVVFLPCGHLVSCTDCAAAMKDCPVCRNHVKGIVRAFMS